MSTLVVSTPPAPVSAPEVGIVEEALSVPLPRDLECVLRVIARRVAAFPPGYAPTDEAA